MNKSKLTWSLMLAGTMFAMGCERETATPTTPAPVPAAGDSAAGESASDATAATAEDAAGRTKTAAEKTGDAAAGQLQGASDMLKKNADAAAASATTSPAAVDTQKQLDQVTTYIREKKWDLAESTMKQVEAKKASLPAALQGRVAQARTMLDTAKKAAATTNPAAAQ